MGLIYKLTFPNGKSYIGLTKRTLVQRLGQHRRDVEKGAGFLVHAAWLKYGEPIASVLLEADGEELKQAERDAIVGHGTMSPAGYNLIMGGPVPIWSAETRAKMGAAHRGKPKSLEQRAKMSAALKGRSKSDETKTKMSTAAMARDPSTRPNLGQFWTGKHHSPEHIENRIACRRGVPRSAETKAKISATKRAKAQKD